MTSFATDPFAVEVSLGSGKDIAAQSPLPCVVLGAPAAYFTAIEVEAGLGLTVRLGVNPGELVDLVLGLFTIDIYRDDIGR